MIFKTVFPKRTLKSVDVLAVSGAVPVGCTVEGGKILPTLTAGETDTSCPENLEAIKYSEVVGSFLGWADGDVYISNNGTSFSDFSKLVAEHPFIVEEYDDGKFKAFIVGDTRLVTRTPTVISYADFEGNIRCGVIKNGRLFGIDADVPFKIRWSGEGGALDWTEGISGAGWVYLNPERGKILDLVVYDEKLIAVREYGLTVISAFGTPENYKIVCTEASTPKVFAQTAAVAAGKLLFFTEDGLYRFNGSFAEKLDCALAKDMTELTYAIASNNEYFACGYSKSLQKRVVIVVEASGNAYLIDAPAKKLAAHGKVFAYCQGGACALEDGGKFSFTSGKIDFGTGGKKVLTRVEIRGNGVYEVEVTNGKSTRRFKNVKGRLSAHIRGAIFKITVKGDCKIDGITAYAEVENGI